MTTSDFDAYRAPQPERRRRNGDAPKRRPGGDTSGAREMSMVEDVEFSSYYGRPIVKAPPWKHEIGLYLFLGGVAGGSSLLAAGAQFTGRKRLRRNTRLTALVAVTGGAAALVADLGRPERFLNMMRTVKVTSPMSLGSWILAGFTTLTAIPAVAEVDRLTLRRLLPLPKFLRKTIHAVTPAAGVGSAVLGAPLAVYTATLFSATANPVWNAARKHLPYVFVSSASLAASGLAMLTTTRKQTKPARILAMMGVAGDLVAMRAMKTSMHPLEREPLETGEPGKMLHLSEILAIAGGIGSIFAGRSRLVAALSGLSLAGASVLTRFGVLEAGIESTHDPKYVIEPQKARLEARRAAGIVDDSITTAG